MRSSHGFLVASVVLLNAIVATTSRADCNPTGALGDLRLDLATLHDEVNGNPALTVPLDRADGRVVQTQTDFVGGNVRKTRSGIRAVIRQLQGFRRKVLALEHRHRVALAEGDFILGQAGGAITTLQALLPAVGSQTSCPTTSTTTTTTSSTSSTVTGNTNTTTTTTKTTRPHFTFPSFTFLTIPPPPSKLDSQAAANFGEANLSFGFSPDPYSAGMTTGGTVDVSYLGGSCSGFATSAPDLRINFGGGGASLLRIYFVGSNGDPAMVVNDPFGNFYCVDDSFGTVNPTIDFNNPAGGSYDVWIASFASNAKISGTLFLTENSGNHP